MADFLAGATVALVVVAVLAVILLRLARRPQPDDAAASTLHVDAMSPRLPKSVNAYWADGRPGQDRRVQWNAEAASRPQHDVEYRAQLGTAADGGKHWDPFDPKEQQRERIRAARRRPRPQHHFGRRDYYEMLGVEPGANDREIEIAFRSRAAEIHPDRYFSDPVRRHQAEERLKELNAAMQVLRDPLRRAKYDASR